MILLLSLACRGDLASTEAVAATAAPKTAAVEGVEWLPRVELTGSLDPAASVQLGFDVPGRIEALLVSRGDAVRKGDALARLDGRLAEAQLAQAEAALAGAQAQLAAGEAAFARLKALRDAGGVSEQQFGDTEGAVLAGRAGVQQAEAAVRLARTHVGNHVLRAPIDGVVTNGPDNPGMVVGGGTPLFVIEDLSALQIKATAPESAAWLAAGQPAKVGDASGTVVRVIPSLDPATRRIPVELRVDAPPPTLRAHAFARATVTATTPVPAAAVPATALVARPDFCVFLADGTRVPVELLEMSGDRAVVRGDLAAGAQVLVDPPREGS
ncbi:MAG: efflux RND transporter periplasmic adaptor subunit [Myxococcota bacterium]